MFFKINGEYIDFDRMNLELNTMGDHGEEKIRLTQLAQPIDILVLKRYNSGGSAETKGILNEGDTKGHCPGRTSYGVTFGGHPKSGQERF